MKFGYVPVREAEGAIMAHSLGLGPQASARRIAKGTVLDADHIRQLIASGIAEVVAAVLEDGDLPEDVTAMRLAQALVPETGAQHIRITGAGAGRVNLYATSCGIVTLDAARIHALNAIDPMISVATVPDYARVDAGGMIATIKIIAYAVPEAQLIRAETGAGGAIRVLPPVYQTATLIETMTQPAASGEASGELSGKAFGELSGKGRAAMAGRLARFDAALTPRVVVPHAEAALSDAIKQATGEMLLILTGSATSDLRDVAPQALRMAGGEVIRFGMPVDPGNLLFIGRLVEKPVIGLPGCARSIALNGADWVLERLICGLRVGSGDIAAMGVGGLLKEIPTRPRPRRDHHT